MTRRADARSRKSGDGQEVNKRVGGESTEEIAAGREAGVARPQVFGEDEEERGNFDSHRGHPKGPCEVIGRGIAYSSEAAAVQGQHPSYQGGGTASAPDAVHGGIADDLAHDDERSDLREENQGREEGHEDAVPVVDGEDADGEKHLRRELTEDAAGWVQPKAPGAHAR